MWAMPQHRRTRFLPYGIGPTLAVVAVGLEVVAEMIARSLSTSKAESSDTSPAKPTMPSSTASYAWFIGLVLLILLIVLISAMHYFTDKLRERREARHQEAEEVHSPGAYAGASAHALLRESRVRLLERLCLHYERCAERDFGGRAPVAVRLRPEGGRVQPHLGLAEYEDEFPGRRGRDTHDAVLPRSHLRQLFEQAGGHMLLLGPPGAGKSWLLQELAKELAPFSANTEQPLPLVFHLGAWATTRRPIAEWLVEQMSVVYGEPRTLAELWIAERKIIPLLDGLDEVPNEHRATCVTAINHFQRTYRPEALVVSSRAVEYRELGVRLTLGAAVRVMPLSRNEIEAYLLCMAARSASAGSRSVAADALTRLEHEPQLYHVLRTPHVLAILLDACACARDGPVSLNVKTLWESLCTAFMRHALLHPRRGLSAHVTYEWNRVQVWLGWLASRPRTATRHDGKDRAGDACSKVIRFDPDHIPREWLSNVQSEEPVPCSRWAHMPSRWAFIGVLVGLLIGLLVFMWPTASPFGLAFGLAVGIAVGRSMEMNIELARVMTWAWWRAMVGLLLGVLLGPMPTLCIWLVFGLFVLILYWRVARSDGGFVSTSDEFASELSRRGTAALALIMVPVLLTLLVVGFMWPDNISKLVTGQFLFQSTAKVPLLVQLLLRVISGLSLAILAGLLPDHVSDRDPTGASGPAWLSRMQAWLWQGAWRPWTASPAPTRQRIWQSIFNTGVAAALMMLLGGFFGVSTCQANASHVCVPFAGGLTQSLYVLFLMGLGLGITLPIFGAPEVAQQVWRRVCAWHVGYAPLFYRHFLEFAADHDLLQRDRGGYRFACRELQAYLGDTFDSAGTSHRAGEPDRESQHAVDPREAAYSRRRADMRHAHRQVSSRW
jgi:hypothetical protein